MRKLSINNERHSLGEVIKDKSKKNKWSLKVDNSFKKLSYPYYYYENKKGERLALSNFFYNKNANNQEGFNGDERFLHATNFNNGFAVVAAGRIDNNGARVHGQVTIKTHIDFYNIINEKGEVVFTSTKEIVQLGNQYMAYDEREGLIIIDPDNLIITAFEDNEADKLIQYAELMKGDKEHIIASRKRRQKIEKSMEDSLSI